MSAPTISTEPAVVPPKPGVKRMWHLAPLRVRAGVVTVAVIAILGIVGTVVAPSIAAQNAANWEVLRQRGIQQSETISKLESSLARAESDRDRAVKNLVPQTELTQREQTVAAAEKSVGDREAAVKGREDAITAKENFVKQTSLTGGKYTVGVSMEAGTYRTENTNSRCYWAVYTSGTNYDDIVQNDLGATGVLTVTINQGQDFETNRCGTWVKIG